MKLIVKQESWWGNKQGQITKNVLDFDYPEEFLFNGAKTLVDYVEKEKVIEEKGLFGRVKSKGRTLYQEVKFGFKVIEKRDDEIELEILGGPFYSDTDTVKEEKLKNKLNITTLKLNESKSFHIQMFDTGDTYTITLKD